MLTKPEIHYSLFPTVIRISLKSTMHLRQKSFRPLSAFCGDITTFPSGVISVVRLKARNLINKQHNRLVVRYWISSIGKKKTSPGKPFGALYHSWSRALLAIVYDRPLIRNVTQFRTGR